MALKTVLNQSSASNQQTHITPTRLNLIGLRPNLLDFGTNHRLTCLKTLPLFHTTHTLRIQLIHPGTLPLYVRHNGNVGNATFHKCLRQQSMMCIRLSPLGSLSRFPPLLFALGFDFVIFIDGRGQLDAFT